MEEGGKEMSTRKEKCPFVVFVDCIPHVATVQLLTSSGESRIYCKMCAPFVEIKVLLIYILCFFTSALKSDALATALTGKADCCCVGQVQFKLYLSTTRGIHSHLIWRWTAPQCWSRSLFFSCCGKTPSVFARNSCQDKFPGNAQMRDNVWQMITCRNFTTTVWTGPTSCNMRYLTCFSVQVTSAAA